jgi:hypothetical protein
MSETFPVFVACVQDARYSERPFREMTVTVDRDRREVSFKRPFASGRMGRRRSIGKDVCLVYMQLKQDWSADAYATTNRGVLRRPIVSSYTTRENEPFRAILVGIQNYIDLVCFIVLDDRDNDCTVTTWAFPRIPHHPSNFYAVPFSTSEELIYALSKFLRKVNVMPVQVLGNGIDIAQEFIRTSELLGRLRPLNLFVKRVKEWWGHRVRSEPMELAIIGASIVYYGPQTEEPVLVNFYVPVIFTFMRAEGFKDAFPVFPGSTGILVDPVLYEQTIDWTRNRSHHLVAAYQWGENRNDSVFLFVIRERTGDSPTYIESFVEYPIIVSESKEQEPVRKETAVVINRMLLEGRERHPGLWERNGRPRPSSSDDDAGEEPPAKHRMIN